MVRCSNFRCERRWFHLPCVGLEEAPEDDWWCSPECSKSSILCFCKLSLGGDMVECERGNQCPRGQWFHCDCVNLITPPGKDDPWYCSPQCQEGVDCLSDDYVENCSLDLLWRGLLDLDRHDAVREGDGDAMVSNWKLDYFQFYQNGHNKYMINAYRLLAGQGGWLPPGLAKEIRWNRTVNFRSGAGHNLEMDLYNEFLNHDFIENVRGSRGQYSAAQLARSSSLVGTVARDIDKLYAQNISDKENVASKRTREDSQLQDVVKLVHEYHGDQLFAHKPGRRHAAFPLYTTNLQEVKVPDKLKERLIKYAKKT